MNDGSFPDIGSKYKITAILGEGAMGSVYKAEHLILNRTVAVKVITSQLIASENDISRFLREARISARLNHPNLVQTYDIDKFPTKTGDSYFLVTEFIDGTTLKNRMEKLDPEDFDEIIRIGKEIFKGLNHAHSAGIVHRDIKPENILITSKGEIKIADFGIARTVNDNQSALTQEGTMIGTPAFMAPEQILTSSEGISFRTDYYATGIILYQMVCGIPPFTGKNVAEILTKHLKEIPVRPSLHNPKIPAQLERLILSLLNKEPDRRPRNGETILAEIDSILTNGQWVQGQQSGITMESGINKRPDQSALTMESGINKRPDQSALTMESGINKRPDQSALTMESAINKQPEQSALTMDSGTKVTGHNRKKHHKVTPPGGHKRTITKRGRASTNSTLPRRASVPRNSGNTEDNQRKRTRIGILLTIIVALGSTVAFIIYSHSMSESQPAPLLIATDKKLPPTIISAPRQYVRQYTVDIDWEASAISPNARVNVLAVIDTVRTTTPCIPYPRYINPDSGIVTYSATYQNSFPNARITAYITGFGDERAVEIASLEFDNLIELDPQRRPPYEEAVFRHCISKLKRDEPELFKKGESHLDYHVTKRLDRVNKEYAPEFTAGPVIIDDRLYVGTNAGQIMAFIINERDGTLSRGWTFNDTKPNYGDFCCFAVKESRIKAFSLRFPYVGPSLFNYREAKAAPRICSDLTGKFKSIVSNYLSEISRKETHCPSYYSINSDKRFEKAAEEDCLPPQRKFKETEDLLVDYERKPETPESLLLGLVKSFSFTEKKAFKIGWFRPFNIQSRYAPVTFDGLIFYVYANFDPSMKERHRKGLEEKWFVKCLDPSTKQSWTFFTGNPLDCTVFNFDRKQEKVYFTDPQNVYCLNYRDRFTEIAKKSSSEIIPESGEYRISPEEISGALPKSMPSSQIDNLLIMGPPILVSDDKMIADNSFYLFLWIDSQDEAINRAASIIGGLSGGKNKDAVSILIEDKTYLSPSLIVFKVRKTNINGKLKHELTWDSKLSFGSKESKNNWGAALTTTRSRLESSLSIVEENQLCLVSIGSELLAIKTHFKNLDSPLEAVLVHNRLSEASRIRNAAIYKNHIYFTLEDAFSCFTMLNKVSFSPTLLLDSPIDLSDRRGNNN